MREADVLSTIKAEVPNAWRILEIEINRARAAVVGTSDNPQDPSNHSLHPSQSENPSASLEHIPQRQSIRKRVKLRVPAEQYPDYNFVGRLLGPRGATLKRLERDTGCRIMIRGKGSIRKDKEAEVRGKPGWEHVFHEPLHVVIEVVDAADDVAAERILLRARELVEMLLIPVPEERDSLKRAQLRDLAILNGTHRSVSDLLSASVQGLGLGINPAPRSQPTLASSPPPLRRAHSHHAKPTQKMYTPDYNNVFDGPGTFTRHNTTAFSPNTPQRAPANNNPYQTSAGFVSNTRESFLPDLDKLHIPALDFDHLNEPNMSSGAFPIPSPSPTIVDPEIYPYPPTPGLINVDQQINAFGSPMWSPTPTPTASRPSASSLSSTSLPPRSPPAVGDTSGNSGASFLLGRPLGDPARHGHNQFSREAPKDTGTFDQGFVSRVSQYADSDTRDAVSQQQTRGQQNPFAGMKNANGDSIILANLFPSSSPSHKGEQPLDQRHQEEKQQSMGKSNRVVSHNRSSSVAKAQSQETSTQTSKEADKQPHS